MRDFCHNAEQDIEEEIQVLVQNGASMDPDMECHEDKELLTAF